ncbi:MAG TPA: MerR family transcriptional regulator, partial [Rhizobacter sp.]|nr:MerR family transcriptional regulator [Rhizobacter sp.]
MTQAVSEAPYTMRGIEEMLGLGRSVITGLIDAGFVSPARGARNEYRFTFQDVVLLRTAYHLRAANIPARKMLRSLRQLKERLPQELPLSGLRIRAIGNDVAVRTADAGWEAQSGQLLMDFEVASSKGSVSFLQRDTTPPPAPATTAAAWFDRAQAAERDDAEAAESAYRQCIAIEADFTLAYVNLGALLCETARSEQALELYDEAIVRCAESPLLHFNRAIALE